MRRVVIRETVFVGGPPPEPPRPLAVVVTEGPPDVVALEPRPEFHSPTEVVLAAVDIDTAIPPALLPSKRGHEHHDPDRIA